MEKTNQSANIQKVNKLSIISSDSSEYYQEDIEFDEISRSSMITPSEDLDLLIETLRATLNTRGMTVALEPNPLENLKNLVRTMCDEFLKVTKTIKEIRISEPFSTCAEEIGVNLIQSTNKDVLSRIFEIPENGIILTKDECGDLASLLVGAIRDSSSNEFKEKITTLEKKLISIAKDTVKLREEIKVKDKEIENLCKEVEDFKLNRSKKGSALAKYFDMESTLNESNDAGN
ncbi:hypothetical protein SteCoe_30710 [Stentor coeruleus]|uniref:Uncharacterized protein n=1 Tax=Stentor coeruleus TaxID=5963 RepID=A0A1R2B339_9CILI|nr:hypothetical protein SteCoe_30710 [Stentor coeruleus]